MGEERGTTELDQEVQLSLLRRYRQERDDGAREKLIASFRKFMWKLANKDASSAGLEPNELFNELYLKMRRIIDTFDIANSCEIRAYVMTSLRREMWHMVGRSARKSKKIVDRPGVLDSLTVDYRGEIELADERIALEQRLDQALPQILDRREYRIVRLKYGLGGKEEAKSDDEVAHIVRKSRSRVSQLLKGAMMKLRCHPQISRIYISTLS